MLERLIRVSSSIRYTRAVAVQKTLVENQGVALAPAGDSHFKALGDLTGTLLENAPGFDGLADLVDRKVPT